MSARIKRGSLRLPCTICKMMQPLDMYPVANMQMLRRAHHAICKSCQWMCRACGQPMMRSAVRGASTRATISPRRSSGGPVVAAAKKFRDRRGGGGAGDASDGGGGGVVFGTGAPLPMPDRQPVVVVRPPSTRSAHVAASGRVASPAAPDAAQGWICEGCAEKALLAQTNVFYRFPMLKYRACPFPVQKYRRIIAAEVSADRADGPRR